MQLDMDEYMDEKEEVLCGCNCPMCNPYHGGHWEYFVMIDTYTYTPSIITEKPQNKINRIV